MPVELRKRKASQSAPAPPAKKNGDSNSFKSAAAKMRAAITGNKNPKDTSTTNGARKAKPAVGDIIDLEGFGGVIETSAGDKITLKQLIDESEEGVVLFTYPKASTPGCTNQASLFRDNHSVLTSTGLLICGLSTDSCKANTTFKSKQRLPFVLLSDHKGTLIDAIGYKKAPKGTQRGVFVVNKQGKVLASEPGGPAATVDVVRKLVSQKGEDPSNILASDELQKKSEGEKEEDAEAAPLEPAKSESQVDDEAKASVAADVADTAEKIDSKDAAEEAAKA
ncbi:MAG: hypothetical protein M1819_007053 [Sarea resinae]|nr:MAG: hypothetical protein M1819_007053 [Sarea resinae]